MSLAAAVRRRPDIAIVVGAVAVALLIYLPTVARGLVNHDDPWLVRDNWLLQHPSLATLRTVFFDASRTTRFVLGAEYLPVRDVTVLVDRTLWGPWYGGDHLVNVLLYAAALVAWSAALKRWGLPRTTVALAVLIFAVLPAHAESVAWISERKGVLALALTGLAALGYARYRAGASARWLGLAIIAAVASVWSKAPSVFTLAALGALEALVPGARLSLRRTVIGLGALAVAASIAFVPVLVVAHTMSVVAATDHAPAGKLVMALGLHGHYLASGFGLAGTAVSYPIATDGPSIGELVLGALGFLVAIAALVRRGRWQPTAELRAASALWLIGLAPSLRLLLPLRSVLVADRYLLVPSLGAALAVAALVMRIANARLRALAAAAIVLALVPRALLASAHWADSRALWERAVERNPHDSDAWSLLAEARHDAGDADGAAAAIERGLAIAPSPRLHLRAALAALGAGDRPRGLAEMQIAADGGEYRAMANLALLLEGTDPAAGLAWARRAVATAPLYAAGHRARGKLALTVNALPEALDAFTQALAIEPSPTNHFNLGLALVALHRDREARPHLEACLADPSLGPRARSLLDHFGSLSE